jgi:hypothetical protein
MANGDDNNPILITFTALRRAVGWLGIALPFVLSIGLYIMNGCSIQDSISQYYYTHMGSYLTGTLCAVGLFLFAYKGYRGENDGTFCNIAAAAAIGVAFIPMQLDREQVSNPECIVFFSEGHAWFRFMHFVSASLFFLTLAYISYFKFTKSDKPESELGKQKRHRNRLYRICGITIVSSLVILAAYNITRKFMPDFEINTLTFFMESIMLIAFGAAWLVKGEGIKYLND